MDQDGTWHEGGPWCRAHCARWGPSSPSQKGAEPPIFGPFLLWPLNGWMHQDSTWYGGRPQPRRHCVRWGSSPPPRKGRIPQFSVLWSTAASKLQLGCQCEFVDACLQGTHSSLSCQTHYVACRAVNVRQKCISLSANHAIFYSFATV